MLFCRVILSRLSVLLQWKFSGGIRRIQNVTVIHAIHNIYVSLPPAEAFGLVTPIGTVSAYPGSDVILPAHLSPETSAVPLDIRWFRGTELIYQYNNRQEKTNYENRASLSIQELERSNLALTLRNFQPADSGDYTCKVFHNGCLQTGTVHLQVRGKIL
uniref:Ig-like domain-containing protein n=1 Tax=Sinocyclocheilus rhinocerous TaxID=307959 RepID=A0A673FVG3_9TELE